MVVQEAPLMGFALAGGQSRRMGRDKALLPFAGGTFLDHALERLGAVCGDVRILAGPSARYEGRGVKVLTDPGVGPLGAILRGLEDSPWGLFLAVDIPGVPTPLLAFLAAAGSGYDAVVPLSRRGPEPLCALYGPACREAIARRLEKHERRASAFFPDVRVRYVSEAELTGFGSPGEMFRNVNTPEELEGLS